MGPKLLEGIFMPFYFFLKRFFNINIDLYFCCIDHYTCGEVDIWRGVFTLLEFIIVLKISACKKGIPIEKKKKNK